MAKDILLDADNDLIFQNGDFKIGESEEQEIKMILQAVKNDYKQYPELGVDLIKFIGSSGSNLKLKKEIKVNLRIDNKTNNRFTVKNGIVEFTA